ATLALGVLLEAPYSPPHLFFYFFLYESPAHPYLHSFPTRRSSDLNAISERIIDAMYEMGVKPESVAKFSGIGCSSKSPAYFMNRSHSFNSVHGRMPSVATGAMLANKDLIALGVTGDGDTVSIGAGQFVHLM